MQVDDATTMTYDRTLSARVIGQESWQHDGRSYDGLRIEWRTETRDRGTVEETVLFVPELMMPVDIDGRFTYADSRGTASNTWRKRLTNIDRAFPVRFSVTSGRSSRTLTVIAALADDDDFAVAGLVVLPRRGPRRHADGLTHTTTFARLIDQHLGVVVAVSCDGGRRPAHHHVIGELASGRQTVGDRDAARSDRVTV
jgi:hypothetical protein